jgi:hypothetical protein
MRIRYQHGNLRGVERKTGPACWELEPAGERRTIAARLATCGLSDFVICPGQ